MNALDTQEVRHISVSIGVPPEKVYDYASKPENLPHWATGLSNLMTFSDNQWWADSPMGKVRLSFTGKNSFGVLDHTVTLPTGESIENPLRVLPNGEGSEIVFTLFRRSDMTTESFERDAAWVEKDLRRLKELLEQS